MLLSEQVQERIDSEKKQGVFVNHGVIRELESILNEIIKPREDYIRERIETFKASADVPYRNGHLNGLQDALNEPDKAPDTKLDIMSDEIKELKAAAKELFGRIVKKHDKMMREAVRDTRCPNCGRSGTLRATITSSGPGRRCKQCSFERRESYFSKPVPPSKPKGAPVMDDKSRAAAAILDAIAQWPTPKPEHPMNGL